MKPQVNTDADPGEGVHPVGEVGLLGIRLQIRVHLYCNSRDCSPPAKKRRGFPFAHCPIPVNLDLFRISSFGFRISGSAGLRSSVVRLLFLG